MAVRYVNEFFPRDDFLADLRPATPPEIAAFQAEHPHARLEWLADDPKVPGPGFRTAGSP